MLQNRHRNHHCMMFPQLAQFTDVALLLLRVMEWVKASIFLGAAEVAGSLGVIFGVLTQLAAAGLY